MKIEFSTAAYQRSHGRNPKGRGMWGFADSNDRNDDNNVFAPGSMTLTEAKKWFRAHLKKIGAQGDLIITILP